MICGDTKPDGHGCPIGMCRVSDQINMDVQLGHVESQTIWTKDVQLRYVGIPNQMDMDVQLGYVWSQTKWTWVYQKIDGLDSCVAWLLCSAQLVRLFHKLYVIQDESGFAYPAPWTTRTGQAKKHKTMLSLGGSQFQLVRASSQSKNTSLIVYGRSQNVFGQWSKKIGPVRKRDKERKLSMPTRTKS
jgi:hypothetical protein